MQFVKNVLAKFKDPAFVVAVVIICFGFLALVKLAQGKVPGADKLKGAMS